MNTNKTFAVGQTTTCQFGNSSDTDYTAEKNENQEVKILAIKQGINNTLYLVHIEGNKVGTATVSHSDRIQGELYCTCALPYGETSYIKNVEQACIRLGFDEFTL